MRIITIYHTFKCKGGAEDMALILAEKLNNDIPVVLTKTPIDLIHTDYRARNICFKYLSLNNILKYNTQKTIFISHARKQTTFLMLLNRIIVHKMVIIHIAHNTFTNLRYFTLFPQNIIAISNAVKQNMIDYFKVDKDSIKVIHNGIEDLLPQLDQTYLPRNEVDKIKILFAGRLCKVKQQVELVTHTRGYLHRNIEFYFAGDGDTLPLLKDIIGKSDQYKILGHIDIKKELYKYDYVCLFSQKEGLGNILIEGCMFGKPLLTNDLDSVLEVNRNNYNGFVAKDWKELILCINSLPNSASDDYKYLSSNARKQYEDFFTFDKMVHTYKEYLESLI